MHEHHLRQVEEWEFLPETFRLWLERAKAPTVEGQIWNQYLELMLCLTSAFARAPLTQEECEMIDIDAHFKAEIDNLTTVARWLLQQEGMGDVETLA